MRTGTRAFVTVLLVALVLGAGAIAGVIGELAGRDTGFVIDRFDRYVEVLPDGRMAVEETVAVTFRQRRRGIFRDLPADGPVRVTYEIYGVDRGPNSEPWPWTPMEIPDQDGVRVRVGDPNVYLTPGPYTYRFRYTIEGLTFVHRERSGTSLGAHQSEVAQVRLDVPGYDWPTRIATTSLTVVLPGEAREVSCVAGARRTIRPCDPPPRVDGRTVDASFPAFAPGRAATIAIDLDAAVFTAPLPSARVSPLTARPGLLPVVELPPWSAGLLLALSLVVPLVALEGAKAGLVYRDERTDPYLHDRIHPTATFAPPRGHRPVEVAGLLLRHFSQRQLLIATLIDLDQRGIVHASTEESTDTAVWTSGIEGAGDDTTFIVRPGPPGAEPNVAERELLDALLPNGQPISFDGEYDRRTARRTAAATSVLTKQAQQVFRRYGYEHTRAKWLRSPGTRLVLFGGVALLLWLWSRIGATVLALPAGAAIAIAVVAAAGWVAARAVWRHHRLPLNSLGRDTVAQARSFREFLATVKAEQLEWAAGQPGIDHHHPAVSLLPYAVALGLADSWYERFGPLLAELARATGAGATTTTAWWASSRGFDSVQTASTGSTTSSSGGGSFGGGGGGSGGGGGGGGSW